MHQDMVQQVRHPGAFRLSSQPKGAVSAAQAIDDVSMKYQAVVHTHVNGLEQEGLAVMRIPEQSCPPLPSQVSSPPPSPPHLVAATQLGHSNLMSLRRRARLLRRTRRPSTPRSPLCTSNSPRERPSTSICGSSWPRRNSKGAPLCCRCLAGGSPDRQLLFRRARCAEKLPQLQSAVGAAAPAVSGRLVEEVSALGERCSNIAQETKSQLDKVMHTCQPGWHKATP